MRVRHAISTACEHRQQLCDLCGIHGGGFGVVGVVSVVCRCWLSSYSSITARVSLAVCNAMRLSCCLSSSVVACRRLLRVWERLYVAVVVSLPLMVLCSAFRLKIHLRAPFVVK